ncbi:MAG: THxN family PEP-CTERM protein [Pseudomonadota bacterium]
MQYRSIPAMLVLSMLLSGTAHAALITVEVTTAGWTLPEGGENLAFSDTDSTAGNDLLLWGGSRPTSSKSGYRFTANPSSDLSNGGSETNEWLIGEFAHLNEVVAPGTSIRRISLDFTLTVLRDADVEQVIPFSVRLRHRETTNDCSTGPNCSDDIVQIEAFSTPTALANLGYDLAFRQNDGFTRRIQTVENTTTSADLVLRLPDAPPTSVAEPATTALLGLGVASLLLVRHRRRNAVEPG